MPSAPVAHASESLVASGHPAMIVGTSAAMQRQFALLGEFALADAPLYIYGETGTGKELVARAVHRLSRRASGRFVAQNCAAIPDTLLQSLLFGHRRGAFTGAERDQIGVFEAAHGGTLLLDEVADMSPTVQAALLRVLQEKEVTRLGEVEPRKVDVRVISASNAPLEPYIETGRFRRDLYFRLVTLRVDLPTLRERRSDVPLLVQHFIAQYNARTGKNIAGIASAALAALEGHAWPGNVRQLEAEVERACILTAAGDTIEVVTLSQYVLGGLNGDGPLRNREIRVNGRPLPEILGDVERALLTEALQRTHGSKSEAARLLGISRQRLSQRLTRWQIGDHGNGW
jgi:transcriptional regulator with PAS, ATPase and Fis domain